VARAGLDEDDGVGDAGGCWSTSVVLRMKRWWVRRAELVRERAVGDEEMLGCDVRRIKSGSRGL
jgi:hypothetical protein